MAQQKAQRLHRVLHPGRAFRGSVAVRVFENPLCSGAAAATCTYNAADGLPVELMSFSVEPEDNEPDAELQAFSVE